MSEGCTLYPQVAAASKPERFYSFSDPRCAMMDRGRKMLNPEVVDVFELLYRCGKTRHAAKLLFDWLLSRADIQHYQSPAISLGGFKRD